MPDQFPETTTSKGGLPGDGRPWGDDIVITGLSGRLPESDNVVEFMENLLAGKDLVTDDERRWRRGLYGLPARAGKIKDLAHFDATFFGVHAKQAQSMCPQLRLLLETTYESIIDSGYNPVDLRGSNTGVFIGASTVDSQEQWSRYPENIDGYGLTGTAIAMFANRISYTFNFRGLSYAIDTACSSSLTAFHNAVTAMKAGKCDAAIVGGVNINLRPVKALHFHRFGMLSPDGTCKSFDATGNGYAMSEGVVTLFLQKAKDARRIYATVVNTGMNNDGFKEKGITFPSGQAQKELIIQVYKEISLDPAEISYIEAHGTGTKAGDPEEVNSITDVFCKNRTSPLLIGSVKSNMGHAEPASGVCSIAKVLMAMEQGVIPQNLHFKSPNTEIPGLLDGRLQVVDKNCKWNGGIAGINSFGFGGVNIHVVLRSNPKPKTPNRKDPIPRLVAISGRTRDAVNNMLQKIESQSRDDEMIALLHDIHSKKIGNHYYRGYTVLSDPPVREVAEDSGEKREIWFIYSGMGSQWAGMGKVLMPIEAFAKAINKCAAVLAKEGVDLMNIINTPDESVFDNVLNSFVAITSVQVGLTDVLISLGISPDGIIGHSSGELGCAYADGCFTLEQAVLAAYWRGRSILDSKLQKGAMAAVALKWEDAKARAPEGVIAACHNAEDSVTVSGSPGKIKDFMAQLSSEGIFTKEVNCSGFAFHSKYIADAGPKLRANLEKLIPVPKPRTKRWKSTSIPESGWNSQLGSTSSAAYHVNNLLSPVLFHEAVMHIPENAIVIEIAPHALLQAVLKRSLSKNCINVGLVKRGMADGISNIFSNIGKLYNSGLYPKLKNLYPPISYPVSRGTPNIASMIEWDHSTEWVVPDFSKEGSDTGENVIQIKIAEQDAFLTGHSIDGRILFPASGYLTLVWKTYAKLQQKEPLECPVIIENAQFLRATIIPRDGSVYFLINIFSGTGDFEVCENGSVIAKGKIRGTVGIEEEDLKFGNNLVPDTQYRELKKEDIYRHFLLKGCEYEGIFKGIVKADNCGVLGELEWHDNWTSFIDTILQFSLIKYHDLLLLPTSIQQVIIDPIQHKKALGNAITIPVKYDEYLECYRSGGVEVRELKTSLAPRYQRNQDAPITEKYIFVPFCNAKSLSPAEALAVQVKLAYENSYQSAKIKIVEALVKQASPIAEEVANIVLSEPQVRVDVSVATTGETPEGNYSIISKDLEVEPVESNCHLLFGSKLLSSSTLLNNAFGSLKEEGSVLSVEQGSYSTAELKKCSDLVIVSEVKSSDKIYVLIRKAVDTPVQFIPIRKGDFKWIDEVKAAMKDEGDTRYILVSDDDPTCGLIGLLNCLRKEEGGTKLRCIFTYGTKFSKDSLKDLLKKDLIFNVFKKGEWGSMRHLAISSGNRTLNVEHAYVNTITRGDLTSLRWIESPLSFYKKEFFPEYEFCNVYYAPLNFRDIMLATGKLSVDALPGDLASQDCVLGLEFSGRDSKGNRVMGLLAARGLATTVLADPDFLWQVPTEWTLEQAATIPVVYSTSYYALIVRGKMRKGESVLIHAGTGGVGMAAITIALSMECNVFTTVGTKEKRQFLLNNFPGLKESHIGNSRDTSFKKMVMRETKGQGVNLILNSLADDKLQASLRCLGQHGRFLEIGKFDLSNDTPLGMSLFLKNTTFHGILLDALFDIGKPNPAKAEVTKLVNEGIKTGVVRPLPTTTFNHTQVEQAFRFMASGKHIGKVLLKVRDEEEEKVISKPKPNMLEAIPKTFFNPEKSYIIVGGLGGLGLELARWMITRGAKNLVLVSRSGITNGYQDSRIRNWKLLGIKVVIYTTDSSDLKGVNELISQANKLGPLGGIFNLAAVLRDAMMENQTAEDFAVVCKSKVDSTKCLDAASRSCGQLDYFVIFSSVASGRGNPGQSNYGLSNSTVERICEKRQESGLPGLTIQWGAIGDVGLVFESLKGNNKTVIGGTLPQRIPSFMDTIDFFLQQPDPILASMVLADKKATSEASSANLVDAIANIFGIKDKNNIPAATSLGDLGMDSLMGSEIKQTLERNYDIVLMVSEIRNLTFGKLLEYSSQIGEQPQSRSESSGKNELTHAKISE